MAQIPSPSDRKSAPQEARIGLPKTRANRRASRCSWSGPPARIAIATPVDFDAAVAAFGYPTSLTRILSPMPSGHFTQRFLRERGASRNHHFSTPRNGSDPGLSSKLFFFCQKAPKGRLHPLCRSDVLWGTDRERAARARPCLTKGLKYSNAPAEADLVSGMGRSCKAPSA